jgi:rod shape-determining protein MreD
MGMSIGPRQELLLPVRPGFLWFTLLLALLGNLLPLEGVWSWLKPDLVALALLFWIVREPRLVGFGVAFALGLAMDIAQASLFGQHALAYTVVAFGATLLRRRLRMFSTDKHILQILPILLTAQAVILLVRLAGGAPFPGWTWFVPSITGALLWPAVWIILLAPQRPRRDPDHPI